ncbi:MAG: UDP-3-O-(3-hydroxymyristoyl)glucosamine N-acyltransferase [Bacteroidota bacterium]
MKLQSPIKLKDIASLIGCRFDGNADHLVLGLNEINKVEPGDLVFVDHPKYYDKALRSAATTILINKKVDCPEGKALIISEDPFSDYNRLVRHFYKEVYSLRHISDSARIGEDTVIHPGVYIGNRVTIGRNCVIYPNVVLYDNCTIGDNVIIHAGTVIGAHAFYYKKRADRHDKLLSCGGVVIENNVEIGALCTIDKGVSGNTVIGEGTKIDNQVQIGHDTVVGKMCLFASQVGISGAVVIEDNVTLWGQVGVPSKLRIGQGAVVLGQSGLTSSLEGNNTYFGSPAGDSREKMKELIALKKLPFIIQKLDEGK